MPKPTLREALRKQFRIIYNASGFLLEDARLVGSRGFDGAASAIREAYYEVEKVLSPPRPFPTDLDRYALTKLFEKMK